MKVGEEYSKNLVKSFNRDFLYVLYNQSNEFFCFRPGPILQITWKEFEGMVSTNKELATNQHKTGKCYTVHIFIQDDQRAFLRKMKEKYVEKYKKGQVYLFSSSVNKEESSIVPSTRSSFFLQKFGDDPEQVRSNSNSIGEFWESMWTVIKPNASEGLHSSLGPNCPLREDRP